MSKVRLTALMTILGLTAVVCGEDLRIKQSPPRNYQRITPPSVPWTAGPIIPGLRQGAIPQGLAYLPEQKRILISYYFEEAPACISVLDANTGKLISCVTLLDVAGSPHQGHVGGIAVLDDSLFVASDGIRLRYDLSDLLSPSPPTSITATDSRRCETNASFCTSTSALLLIGEFALGNKYPTNGSHHLKNQTGTLHHAWVCGYAKDKLSAPPTCILSIPDRVQGMCVLGDHAFLSMSYGRSNRSTIAIHANPFNTAPHRFIQLNENHRVPLWFLDQTNHIGSIDYPPMSEGITMLGDRLAVLSESGADKYQLWGKGPLDRLMLLDVSALRNK